MLRSLALLLCLLPLASEARIYKCVDQAGNTSYGQQPCPQEKGTTSEVIELRPSAPPSPVEPPALPEAQAGNAAERLHLALLWLQRSYPFLVSGSPQADPAAIAQMLQLQQAAMDTGVSPADALVQAALLVGRDYRPAPAVLATPASQRPAETGGGLTVIEIGREEPPRDETDVQDSQPVWPQVYRPPYWHDSPVWPPHYPPPRPPRPRPPPVVEEPPKIIHGIPLRRD